jgi:DNA-binding protein YbaB
MTDPAGGLRDQAHYERLAQAALTSMDAYEQTAKRLAAVPVTGRSRDGRVMVRVTAAGELVTFHLRAGTLRRYDSVALGEVVTRTLRETQERARARYEREMSERAPAEVAECERIVREALDRAAAVTDLS